jgi:drug/metabolite transporter (DMT)-like permease
MSLKSEVLLSTLAYSLCSGTLVLINKLTLHQLPYPSLIVSFQLVATLFFIYTAKSTRLLAVDELRWKYVKPYMVYIIAFSLGVYSNMKSLSMSNVETIIVFRSLSPCIVAFLDAIFLGREYPSRRSWFSLAVIVVGAYGYASYDVKFQTQGMSAYRWPIIYLALISFEMAYGKRIIKSVDLKTKSGPVLYTNLLGLPPMLLFAGMAKEYTKFAGDRIEGRYPFTAASVGLLILGCIAGIGIGYSGWWCRDKVSATSYTLIGVMNKCLTILLNLAVWDQHAPMGGIACLGLCLLGGMIYRQAPMRAMSSSKLVANYHDDIWEDGMDETFHVDDSDELVSLTDSHSQQSLISTQDIVTKRR